MMTDMSRNCRGSWPLQSIERTAGGEVEGPAVHLHSLPLPSLEGLPRPELSHMDRRHPTPPGPPAPCAAHKHAQRVALVSQPPAGTVWSRCAAMRCGCLLGPGPAPEGAESGPVAAWGCPGSAAFVTVPASLPQVDRTTASRSESVLQVRLVMCPTSTGRDLGQCKSLNSNKMSGCDNCT